MLPSVGYFKSIVCPYFENDTCDRPHCQFRHEHLPVKTTRPSAAVTKVQEPCSSQSAPEADKSSAIEQIVSEAVKRVLKENGQLLENFDASKIMELVGQQKLVEKVVEHLAPPKAEHKSKSHKTYNIPAGTPAYTPTPIAVLKKKPKVENYVPAKSSTNSTATYKPSKVTSKEDVYTPSTSDSTPDVNYTPSSKESDKIDHYTPPSSLDCEVDYKPSNRDLITAEPSYSPSSLSDQIGVNYSPSSISSLTTEPSYSPYQANSAPIEVDYTPSSLSNNLSPEKYLELFEDEEPKKKEDVPAKKKDELKKKEDEKKKRERKRRKEKEKKREKVSSSKSSDSDSKSRRSSKQSSSSKQSKSPSKKSEPVSTEMDSDSDVDEQCYRIFKEYKPTTSKGQLDDQKKRKSDEIPPQSEAIIPVKKQRVAHVSIEAPSRPVAPAKPPQRLTPGMVMVDRFKRLQEARAAAAASPSSSRPFAMPTVSDKKRIAHVPNVVGLLSSKPKVVSVPVVQRPVLGNAVVRKPAPKAPSLPRPMIAVELGCRVPANVRQKYLNVLVDEVLKIYDREEDAYERAVEEEKQAYAKCSSKVVYINVITNLVQRIRREVAEKGSDIKNTTLQGDRKVMSHSAVLAGKGGATVSWSIERPKGKIDTNLLKGSALFRLLERHILTMEQQDFNGYPRPDPNERGRAIVNPINKFRQKPTVNVAYDQRVCDRCGVVYHVNFKGLAVREDDSCSYHWGKPFQRRGETRYTCCKGEANSDGCSVGKWHVSDMISLDNLKGFVRTLPKSPPSDGNYGVFALDCEMCYTTEGPELTRVTVISSEMQTVYETLVKPDNPILDHNTRFSGITEEDLVNVKTTIRDVQAVLLSKFSDKTILIGHSFDSDLRALRMIHDTVIDTSVVFPHTRGPPYKKALRTLCADILQKIIQNDVGGHDSAEDAIACMELMLWKVKQDLKQMK